MLPALATATATKTIPFESVAKKMSLRNQINIRMFCIAIVILVTGSIMAVWKAKQSVEDEVSSSYHLVSSMMEFSINQLERSSNFDSDDLWITHISNLQEARHVRFQIINNGKETFSFIQEERDESSPPFWFISAIKNDFPFLEKEINLPGYSDRKIVISTDPADEIQEAWEEFYTFLWSIIPTLGVLFLAINAVFNYIFKAVQNIIFSLNKLTESQYDYQLPGYNINEFNLIAKSVNKLAIFLKETRKSNKELIRHSLQIQEQERETMAKELHDEMGQSIVAIKAIAFTAKHQNDATKTSDQIVGICNHLSQIISSRMRTLHPLSLDELGLGDTLKNLVTEWGRNHPDTKVSLSFTDEIKKLSPELPIHLYRIVQECLTNIAKHASATQVTIQISDEKNDNIKLLVTDNGTGFDKESVSNGFGLRGMKERAESQGGYLNVNSYFGQGTEIAVVLPLQR